MSILQRAVSMAATIACALGLVGANTPGQAAELAHAPALISVPLNVLSAVPVPAMTQSPPVEAAIVPAAPAPQPDPILPHYASLSAAVDAQVVGDAASDDLGCLAGAIYFEAKGEPLPGQLAVANVIINRAKSGRYPPDICGVVTQHGQFSFVRGGTLPPVNTGCSAYRTALKLAKIAIAKLWDSPAPSALFFHARRVGIGRGAVQVASIGNHIFYR